MFNNFHCKILLILSEINVPTFFQNLVVEGPYGIIQAEIHGIMKMYDSPSKISTL